jgi:hypothetical protein
VYTLLLVAIFGAVSCLAIVAYVAGESLRHGQRAAVDAYVAKLTEARERREELRKKLEIQKHKRLEEETRRARREFLRPASARDRELTAYLTFMNRVARESPGLLASTLKRYVQLDPAVVSGEKRPADRAGLGEASAAPPKPAG